MQRLESKTVSDLTNEQREVLDAINSGPRGGSGDGVGLIGPYGVWVRAPKVGPVSYTHLTLPTKA